MAIMAGKSQRARSSCKSWLRARSLASELRFTPGTISCMLKSGIDFPFFQKLRILKSIYQILSYRDDSFGKAQRWLQAKSRSRIVSRKMCLARSSSSTMRPAIVRVTSPWVRPRRASKRSLMCGISTPLDTAHCSTAFRAKPKLCLTSPGGSGCHPLEQASFASSLLRETQRLTAESAVCYLLLINDFMRYSYFSPGIRCL